MMMNEKNIKHRGRFAQVFIYLGKLFRMFIFQNDWKVLPMSAIIAGLVSFVVGANLFKTQEGTLMGTFALSCICIWNGFFNSIQVICRERPIVKREHRSGMHISAYITAHMIYQAFLCLCQTVITIFICYITKVRFPDTSLITPWAIVDIGITLFLITYCADMMALMISSFVHSSTAAMTIMPFLLIFQLVFSGAFFQLSGVSLKITNITITKWGLTALCAQGDYNDKPMVSLWNAVAKMQNMEIDGTKPIQEFMTYASESDVRDRILKWCGMNNQNELYAFDAVSVLRCWGFLVMFTVIYAAVAVICLEFIDKDKR
ncbi:MAG: ABC transporter permease [Lachnospiraceae bacterium]|nr:ABC transporter permease [Lachnospiraceae bacterium]